MRRICKAIFAAALSMTILPAPYVLADNPIVQTRFTADPAPMVSEDGETLYLFTSHDEPEGGENGAMYVMNDWNLYSTRDMVNWTDLGVPTGYKVFDWAKGDAWAIQTVERNGKFYLYAPVTGQRSTTIGVAAADRIEGPYTDPLGKPLIQEPCFIDPSVYVDGESGRAFIVWGNPQPYFAELNDDMISFKTKPVQITKTEAAFGKADPGRDRETRYEEGPWLTKHGGYWYLAYAGNGIPEDLEYSVCTDAEFNAWVDTLPPDDGKTDYANGGGSYASVEGPWKYGGVLMETFDSGTFTNHPGLVDYKDKSYLFYHTAKLPGSGGFRRSVSVDAMSYNGDGSISAVSPTASGAAQIKNLNPYTWTEAETIAFAKGLESGEYYTAPDGKTTEEFTDNDAKHVYIKSVDNGDYIKVSKVDFGGGAGIFGASVRCGKNGGEIELRLDGENGALIGTLPVSYTAGEWQEKCCAVSGAAGVHDLYMVFRGESRTEDLFDFDYWKFTEKTADKMLKALNAVTADAKIDIKDGINTTPLTVTAVYSDGTSEDITRSGDLSVSSDNVKFADGIITGTSYGDAVITVSYNGVSEKIRLEVKDLDTEVTAAGISADPASVKLVYGGVSAAVTVTATYKDNHTEDVTDKAVYSVEDDTVAEVNKGVLTPKRVGETVLDISYTGKLGGAVTARVPVTVTDNMIKNGDFEEEEITAPWNEFHAKFERATEGDNHILKVSGRNNDEEWQQGTANGAHYTLGQEVKPGRTYSFSARLRYDDGPETRDFQMALWNSFQPYYSSYVGTDSAPPWGDQWGGYTLQTVKAARGEWTEFSGTVTIPAEADNIRDDFALAFVTSWVQTPAENDLMDYCIDDVTFALADSVPPTAPPEPTNPPEDAKYTYFNDTFTGDDAQSQYESYGFYKSGYGTDTPVIDLGDGNIGCHMESGWSEDNGIVKNVTRYLKSGETYTASVDAAMWYWFDTDAKVFFEVRNRNGEVTRTYDIASGRVPGSGELTDRINITGSAKVEFGADEEVFLCIKHICGFYLISGVKLSGNAEPPTESEYDYIISSVTPAEGGFSVSVTGSAESGAKPIAVVALYGENGALVGVGTQELDFNNNTASVKIDVNNDNYASLSAFIWDSLTGMTPLSEAYTE